MGSGILLGDTRRRLGLLACIPLSKQGLRLQRRAAGAAGAAGGRSSRCSQSSRAAGPAVSSTGAAGAVGAAGAAGPSALLLRFGRMWSSSLQLLRPCNLHAQPTTCWRKHHVTVASGRKVIWAHSFASRTLVVATRDAPHLRDESTFPKPAILRGVSVHHLHEPPTSFCDVSTLWICPPMRRVKCDTHLKDCYMAEGTDPREHIPKAFVHIRLESIL